MKSFFYLFVIFSFTAIAADGNGPANCYRHAKYYTNLSIAGTNVDETSIAKLCRGAKDESPAKCYNEATINAGASKEVAIEICRPVLCSKEEAR